MIESKAVVSKKCLCKGGYCVDRMRDGKESCPSCDPSLGPNPDVRLENYKLLISHPVPKNVMRIFTE